MTRLLHLITSAAAEGGGPIEAARTFGEVWRRDGHVHDLVTLDPQGAPPPAGFPGRVINLGPLRGATPWRRYRYAPALMPWLRAHAARYDAVIVSGLWRYQTRGALRALAGGTVPWFVFPHGMLDPWFRRAYPLKHLLKQLSWWWAEGPLLAGAAGVLFTAEEERRLAEGAFRPYRVRGLVVPYGARDPGGDPAAQVAAFRGAVPALGSRRFLLFLGRLHAKKGCDLLVEAFAAHATAHPALDLVVAGPDQSGLAAGLAARAAVHGLAGRVHFPGMLTGAAKTGAYRAAEAFALPSHQENFGIVVAEALACGTPVLLSDKVNIWREALDDGAALVEPDTPDGTRRLLARFLALDGAARAAMRANARASFERRFDVAQAAGALMRLIEARVTETRVAGAKSGLGM